MAMSLEHLTTDVESLVVRPSIWRRLRGVFFSICAAVSDENTVAQDLKLPAASRLRAARRSLLGRAPQNLQTAGEENMPP